MIAFDGKDCPAQGHSGDAKDEGIGNIAAADEQVGAQFAVEIDLFFVCYNNGSQWLKDIP